MHGHIKNYKIIKKINKNHNNKTPRLTLTTFSSSTNTFPEFFSGSLVLKSIVMSVYLLALKSKVRWEVGSILCAFVSKLFFNIDFF